MKFYKRIASLALGMLLIGSTISSAVALIDIGEHWAKGPIEKLVEEKVINGYEDKTFKPDNPISRGEASKMISTYFDKLIKSKGITKSFIDVDSSIWSEPYIKSLVDADIIKGYLDNTFKPEDSIKRSEASKMIYEALENTGKYKDNGISVYLKDISGHWAEESINKLVSMGAIDGYGGGIFMPESNITRAELAKILYSLSVPYKERITEEPETAVVNAPEAYGIQLNDSPSTAENIEKWILESISVEDKDGNPVINPEIELNQDELDSIENATEEGNYTIKYSYTDKDGNTIEGTIDVIVVDFDYDFTAGDNVIVNRYRGTSSTIAIPKYISGKLVTEIGWDCFDRLNIKEVIIPNSVTTIRKNAFRNCEFLKKIDCGDSVTIIDESAFAHCSSLREVTIGKKVQHIGLDAFKDCQALETVNFNPESKLSQIGGNAFKDCNLSGTVYVPKSIKNVYTSDDSYDFTLDGTWLNTIRDICFDSKVNLVWIDNE